ncbi:MAG: pitrilysin family protein [Bacteroidota bacterium]
MINRTLAPELKVPAGIVLTEPLEIKLKNKSSLYIISAGTQDVCKLELIFDAGSAYHKHPLIASVTNELIDEGTSTRKSAEIADLFDYYGAYLQTECTVDYASITLYSLNKFLEKTVALLVEVLNDPSFPEDELETYIQQERQRLTVNLEKVDYLSRKHFNHALYKNHIYGYFPDVSNYNDVSSSQLKSFYKTNYTSGLKAVILSGKTNDKDVQKITSRLNELNFEEKTDSGSLYKLEEYIPVTSHFERPGAVQNAIRIGRRLFNRKHPDYPKLTVLNTILGGYFGSRLMTNIREDKGYTYGIGSGLASLADDGYFYISTEVGADVCEAALKEIYIEVAQLREHVVPEQELALVKNYLYGSFQRSMDGPFAISDRFKTVLLSGLNYDYFRQYLDTLKNITPNEVLAVAEKYLSSSGFTQVTVGKK